MNLTMYIELYQCFVSIRSTQKKRVACTYDPKNHSDIYFNLSQFKMCYKNIIH